MQHSTLTRHVLSAFALAILSAALRAGDVTAPVFLSPFPQLLRNPIRWVPQSARIKVFTDEPTQVWIEFDDGSGSSRVELADAEFTTNHTRIPIVGLKHGRTTDLRVIVRDASGNEATWPTTLVFPARALPADFPPLNVQVADTELMEPGYTLFATRGVMSGVSNNWIIALDRDGDVVWYYRRPGPGGVNIEQLRNGNLLWSRARHTLELDILGKVLNKWYPGRLDAGSGAGAGAVIVDTDSFHHEMREMPEGEEADFLALSSELRVFDDYPIDEIDTSMTMDGVNVIGDVIVEFKRDGTIVRELKLLDVLDPFRLCYDSIGGFWDSRIYGTVTPGIQTQDWSHANSVVIDTNDDTYVVSVRHQDAVVKIDRQSGQIVWIHGAHERWNAPWDQYLLTPVGHPHRWQFHQHAPEINADGNLVLFDNGNWRAIPPTTPSTLEQSFSRAIEFRIDPVNMTSLQIWWYGSPAVGSEQHMFSRFICDADPLPESDNIPVTNGGNFEIGVPVNHVLLLELTRTRPAVKVFEATIKDENELESWTVYRSERIPSLYHD